MARVTNREAAGYIARLKAFNNSTGSLRGEVCSGLHITPGRLSNEANRALRAMSWSDVECYVVYSYHTPQLVVRLSDMATWDGTGERYSVTTSRHQGIVRQGIRAL